MKLWVCPLRFLHFPELLKMPRDDSCWKQRYENERWRCKCNYFLNVVFVSVMCLSMLCDTGSVWYSVYAVWFMFLCCVLVSVWFVSTCVHVFKSIVLICWKCHTFECWENSAYITYYLVNAISLYFFSIYFIMFVTFRLVLCHWYSSILTCVGNSGTRGRDCSVNVRRVSVVNDCVLMSSVERRFENVLNHFSTFYLPSFE